MFTMIEMVKTVLRSKKGQGMVEYGLILALVAVAAVGAYGLMGDGLDTLITAVTGDLQPAQ